MATFGNDHNIIKYQTYDMKYLNAKKKRDHDQHLLHEIARGDEYLEWNHSKKWLRDLRLDLISPSLYPPVDNSLTPLPPTGHVDCERSLITTQGVFNFKNQMASIYATDNTYKRSVSGLLNTPHYFNNHQGRTGPGGWVDFPPGPPFPWEPRPPPKGPPEEARAENINPSARASPHLMVTMLFRLDDYKFKVLGIVRIVKSNK